MDKPHNPPAFPSEQHECADGSWNQTYSPGMTLRDWFAGQTLMGMCGNSDIAKAAMETGNAGATLAESAYDMADAMLAQRAKGD